MNREEILTKLQPELARRIGQALESMTGRPSSCRVIPESNAAGLSEGGLDTIGWAAAYNVHPEATVALFASREAAQAIGKEVLEAAGIEEFDEPTLESTYQELIAQAVSSWSQDLSGIGRQKWEVETAKAGAVPRPELPTWGYELDADGKNNRLIVQVSTELLSCLALEDKVVGGPATTSAVTEASGASTPFDLLLDVELPVSVSFGRALIPLKEVLKLSSGSIVELNRAVSEPVEVIVNNCVIARGEVVVVEGNYGVRIQQIVSRQDRLKSMN